MISKVRKSGLAVGVAVAGLAASLERIATNPSGQAPAMPTQKANK